MSDFEQRAQQLSPERRRLLELMLEKQSREEAEEGRGSAAAEDAIPRRSPDDPRMLSYAQQRLWFIDQMQPGVSAYNIPSAVRLQGPLDVGVLERCLNEIVRRHETLRTRFKLEGSRPVPVIEPERKISLDVEDLAAETESAEVAEAEAKGRVDRLARTPFDLENEDMLRVHLLRLGEENHVLLVVMHHTVSDTWTTGVFLREVAALYAAFSQGEPSPLPKLPIQYVDYALWQRRQYEMEDGPLQREADYWKEKLADAPQLLELPTDRPRPPVQSFRGGRVMLRISQDLTLRLKARASEEEATFFMILLASFQVLLMRYTGERDVLVGSPIANRDRVELEGLIGLFVNTLVLRGNLEGNPTFRSFLDQVRETCLEAFAHHDLPFERLVEELDLDRNTSRNPLFQVLFAFQNVPLPRLEAQGLTLSRYEFEETTARLDLELDLQEMDDGVVGWIGYNADLFDHATIERMTRHYHRLLAQVAEDPDQRAWELPLLTEADRQRILRGFNDTAVPFSEERTLHGLVEAQVDRTPDAVAVVAEGDEFTYREIDQRANRLARTLLDAGVRPGAPVALHVKRGVGMIEAVLGVLKAGGMYVPVDLAQPEERMQAILDSAGVRHLVTDVAQLDAVDAVGDRLSTVICLDAAAGQALESGGRLLDRSDLEAAPGGRVGVEVDPGALAYVIFTSGSTGRPKGVMVRHRPVINLIEWVNGTFDVGPSDRLLFVTSLSFDLSVYDVFGILAAGGSVRVASAAETRDPQALVDILCHEPVTFWDSAPAALQQLVPFLPEEPVEDASLRLVFQSGDWIPVTLPDEIRAVFPEARMIGLGGATEATVWSNWFPIGEVDPEWVSIPYGRPIQNARYHVVDPRLEPTPVGVPGDLYIGGRCLSSGYLASPALTAGKYLPDPWSERPGGRLYRTGDRARYRPDGNLEFLGRLDHQVKIRGYRIELGEIQAALLDHAEVDEAVVLVREDVPGDRRLVAYLVAHDGEPPQAGELRTYLQRKLPEYMVPSHFVSLDEMPVTPNGKLDRKALPAPDRDRPELDEQFVDPQTEMERIVAEVWQEVLQVDRVGSHDDFFELGGHSLLLTRVHQELKARVAPDLKLVDLFQHPTVQGLAGFLGSDAGAGDLLESSRARAEARSDGAVRDTDVAIVGMALRVPGANDARTFWDNLRQGLETVSFFSKEEILANGVPRERVEHPDFVPAEGEVEGVDMFDAAFFGYSPREAEMMDPQHRFFLECCWEALENAGYDPMGCPGAVGVYGAVNVSSYLFNNLSDYDALGAMGDFHTRAALLLGNSPDFLAQRVSYHLGLEGPSVNIQTACSSALVAVHTACQNLLHRECDMALAGGVQMRVPQRIGYLYKEGGLPSPDGHCRSFDHRSKGTVHGNGLGVVVLKRLSQALEDGDHVYGVIKGSAVTNDAGTSVGFTAPSVDGQARAAAEALAMAGVDPREVDFLEANGTGTEMGDPIEFAALARVFGAEHEERGYCALGSVKTNIGHLDTAAGVASLIKATLALEHGEIPPTLHFEKPNPNIDLESSPFYINTETVAWPDRDRLRRAAVNNFGVGGTNAHLILEQAPKPDPQPTDRPWLLLPISARSSAGLHQGTQRLREYLESTSDAPMPDVAYTLQVGRHPFPVRRLVMCRDRDDALEALESLDPSRVLTSFQEAEGDTPVVMWLPGDGRDELGIDADLFAREPEFRRAVKDAAASFAERLDTDLTSCFTEGASPGEHGETVLFLLQIGLAALWRAWGLEPREVRGRGVGRVAAAVIAGDLDLESAVDLVLADPSERRQVLAESIGEKDPETFFNRLVDGPELVLVLGPGDEATEEAVQRLDPEQILLSVDEEGRSHGLLLRGLGRAWLAGAPVHWAGFQASETRRRVPLPTYPWEHQRFWREPARRELAASRDTDGRERKREPQDWLYVPTWHRAETPPTASTGDEAESHCWLVFEDEVGLGEEIGRLLETRGDRVLRIAAGDEPTFPKGTAWRIRPGRVEDCDALLGELQARDLRPDRALHLWGVTGGRREPATPEGFLTIRRRGLETLLALGRSLATAGSSRPMDVTVVTDGVQEVLGTEDLMPEKAAVLAAVKVLPQENPGVECRAVDVVWPDDANGGVTRLAESLLAETGTVRRDPVVALRGRRRWVQAFERLDGPEQVDGPAARLRNGGVYLLTGADGTFAMTLAQALWDSVQARMAWVVSPEAPEEIDDATTTRRLEALRGAGAEIEIVSADVTDPAALAAAIQRTEERFGALHGVLHSARDHGGQFAATVTEIDAAVLDQRMGERIRGLWALEEALAGRELDFVLLSSSLAGTLGGLGVTADAAADAVLDAWAAAKAAGGSPWLSLAWDAWHPSEDTGRRSTGTAPAALGDDDVAEALCRVLDAGIHGPVALSITDLEPRLDRWLRRKGLPEQEAPGTSDPGQARPQLATAYVAPRNDLERMIAGVWEELFGIEDIGVYDDFYELGGHSLLGTQVATRIREQLDVELPLRDFLEYTTIADLAQALAERQVERADPEDLEQFLAELEAMSEEEAALDASS